MYALIRLALVVIASILLVTKLKKSKFKSKKRATIIGLCSTLILWSTLEFIPFENLFVTFDSPEASYRYMYFSASNDPLIVSGDSCDLLIDCDNRRAAFNNVLIPKTENGWKISRVGIPKCNVYRYDNGVTLNLYRYKNTDDYFLTITRSDGTEIELSADNAEFDSVWYDMPTFANGMFLYYAHVNELGYITIDGEYVKLGDVDRLAFDRGALD